MRKLSLALSLFLCLLCVPLFGACAGGTDGTKYTITAAYDAETRTLTAEMELNYKNDTDNALGDLRFHLFGNAYRQGAKYAPIPVQYYHKAYYDGMNYGSMTVTGAAVNGEAVAYTVGGEDENILIVPLAEALFPNERATVTIAFTVTLAKVNHRLGVGENTVNFGNFYPILCPYGNEGEGYLEYNYYVVGDPFVSACADYDVTFTVPEGFEIAASGRAVNSSRGEGTRTFRYLLSNARDFAVVLGRELEVLTDSFDGVEINYYYFDDENAEEHLAYAVQAMQTFSELFGAYSYKTLAVVQADLVQGGMEYPGLVYCSAALDQKEIGEVVVHEVAHQWWYAAVGSNQVTEAFLDEGLAEYSVVLFYEKHPEYGLTREALIQTATRTYQTYCSVYDKIFGGVDTSMTRPLPAYSGEYEYVNVNYIKGCLMFDCLRIGVGDERFFGGLKNYYAAFAGKIATAADLIGVYEALGCDVQGFFSGFLDGKVIL